MTMPTIRTARAICQRGELQGVLVIGFDGYGLIGGASYGASKKQCGQLGKLLDFVIKAASDGKVSLTAFDPGDCPFDGIITQEGEYDVP